MRCVGYKLFLLPPCRRNRLDGKAGQNIADIQKNQKTGKAGGNGNQNRIFHGDFQGFKRGKRNHGAIRDTLFHVDQREAPERPALSIAVHDKPDCARKNVLIHIRAVFITPRDFSVLIHKHGKGVYIRQRHDAADFRCAADMNFVLSFERNHLFERTLDFILFGAIRQNANRRKNEDNHQSDHQHIDENKFMLQFF